eukprot:CAMPEP_0204526466 /NCGR_PEP_ID=MMETSP0661-20131031/8458_1 /ASSEMBLY_ACC=CAM_ASM_000606 /TAXON_ID=109239 /ORGANISM="Alexandrium margalefi, Strain AMGDE01CS-322" /LENGTH=466 /DNA_ID=CAMNT_0051532315 /DNA_START=41 /DNA_END=1441 /DNA_ORIENTATION=+
MASPMSRPVRGFVLLAGAAAFGVLAPQRLWAAPQPARLPAALSPRGGAAGARQYDGPETTFCDAAPLAGAAAVLCAAVAGGLGRRSRTARLATETFQQLSFSIPTNYEAIADTNPCEKKTDIICTIGPKSWDPEVLVKLMEAGMNIIRCNMSHGDHEEQSMKLANLEKAYEMRPEFRGKIKVLMDTRGPEIRTGTFEVYNSKKELKAGQDLKLVTDYSVKGDESQVAITYKQLPRDVKPGQRILVQDGTVVLEVASSGEDYVMCKVINDSRLGEKKNVNVPGVKVDIPVVGEREVKDITEWAVPNNADYIALSFVQSAEDVKECRKHCDGKPIKIISKIENVEGLKNFDDILAESDGIMVARGDLGMEIPMEKVWMAQKMMVKKTKDAGKYVVTATEMLASMEDKPFPTRAEACDVANAVLDGTDAVMLSSEVAMGDFPVETVETMRRIGEEAESAMVPEKELVAA